MAVVGLGEQREYALPKEHLSPSQVYLMVTCGRCFELQYVEGVPRAPSANFAIGRAVHAAVQLQREGLMDGREARHVLDHASDAFDEAVTEGLEDYERLQSGWDPALWPDGTEVDLSRHKDVAMQTAEFACEQLLGIDSAVDILAVEQDLDFTDIFPFPFKARADMIATATVEEPVLIYADLKTAADRRTPTWWPRTQLHMYSLPAQRNKTAVLLRVDQVTKQEQPQFQSYFVDASQDWYDAAWKMVMDAAADISAGRFRLRPTYSCAYSHNLPITRRSVEP